MCGPSHPSLALLFLEHTTDRIFCSLFPFPHRDATETKTGPKKQTAPRYKTQQSQTSEAQVTWKRVFPGRKPYKKPTISDRFYLSIKSLQAQPGLLPIPTARATVVENAGILTICAEKMEAVVEQLIKGQERLEWAVAQQLTAAQADREILREVLTTRREGEPNHRAENTPGPVRPSHHGVALQKYQQGEDPDAFVLNFERAAQACGWPIEQWTFFLAPLLTGEAQAAYQVANPTGDVPYGDVKRVILDHLGLDSEAYRLRFRREKGVPGESPKTLFIRLKMAAYKWLTPGVSSKAEIMDRIYLEQFLEALPFPTPRWLLRL